VRAAGDARARSVVVVVAVADVVNCTQTVKGKIVSLMGKREA
jgi:hypothetical protein